MTIKRRTKATKTRIRLNCTHIMRLQVQPAEGQGGAKRVPGGCQWLPGGEGAGVMCPEIRMEMKLAM